MRSTSKAAAKPATAKPATAKFAADIADAPHSGFVNIPGFRFVPHELADRCHKLIDSYHELYGYVGLADMLWLSDARDVVQRHRALTQMFKTASKSRGARRANHSLLLIAAIIMALEVLARDFAGWGKRFPAAKREAETMLGDTSRQSRTWLMDLYLYPPPGMRREFTDALAPPASDT
jgi:hypothetical protein